MPLIKASFLLVFYQVSLRLKTRQLVSQTSLRDWDRIHWTGTSYISKNIPMNTRRVQDVTIRCNRQVRAIRITRIFRFHCVGIANKKLPAYATCVEYAFVVIFTHGSASSLRKKPFTVPGRILKRIYRRD